MLVAISIPIFTTQLEKSRDSVSISNIRAAYAEASSVYLASNGLDVTEGRVTVDAANKKATVTGVALKGTSEGWSNLDGELSFTHSTMTNAIGGTAADDYVLEFTFADDGTCTLSSIATP